VELLRRESRPVRVGGHVIGGGQPIVIQSMTTTSPADTEGSLRQILALAAQGCTLVRLAVPSARAAAGLARLREQLAQRDLAVALVADVHFNPRLAEQASRHVEKVRINPGNFASSPAEAERELSHLIPLLAERGCALRIGVNQGSLPPYMVAIHGGGPAGMVAAAMEYLRLCCAHGFTDVVVSLKSSNPSVMVAANRLLAAAMDAEGFAAPIHLGVTEAGEGWEGACRSGVGIGTLLLDGIGDTIRVSLTGDPADEIPVCRAILAGVERAGGLGGGLPGKDWFLAGGAQEAARDTHDARASTLPRLPRTGPESLPSFWKAIALGGSHPPRIERAFELDDGGPEPDGSPATGAPGPLPEPPSALSGAISTAPSAAESLVLRLLTREARTPPPATARIGALRALVATAGVPLWIEIPGEELREVARAAGARLEALRAAAREADGIIVRISPAWAQAAGASESGPEWLGPVLAGLASPRAEGGGPLLLRWHFELPAPPANEEAGGLRLRPVAMLASKLSSIAHEAGFRLPAFSCSGRPQVAFLRGLAATLEKDGQRPLFAATLPRDPWEAVASIGTLLLDRLTDAVSVDGPGAPEILAAELLHATRRRLSRAEFISCPGCGRLPFDLAPTVRRLKQRFGHLRDVKIAVMGCSVNGPGEMADADFGYVGAAADKVDLYAGARRVHHGLAPAEAEEALAQLLKESGHEV